ncbi:hypothetical protein [Fusobacterium necrophorum]|uniref:hypothetical protein n=1 Tax=Fusobacterium necrophorum TaxID=859 RepID=UPI0001BC58FA
MTLNKIVEFAKNQGYDNVKFLKQWNGYSCYEPYFSDGISFTGLPLVILVKEDEIRMSTPEESMEI